MRTGTFSVADTRSVALAPLADSWAEALLYARRMARGDHPLGR